ncbi:C4-dicarboxylate ABC transporter [Marinobacterium nitratireducens]|uniref:C4-dicarboxylate ABC transporter n=1 Tax=Marinobacterium nitratireducens TaxID=518897 RepID=A0A917Z6Y5_9GAMM|nr:TRAP transporter substrate-binding protein [Marinobacterium nitratireducens]GGO76429.1 C4-dicarboxylate ABC transporter [Marinobacterium nitratireducens]
MKKNTLLSAILLSTSLVAGSAQAETHSLRLAHFWPAGSSVDEVVQDWAKTVHEASDGRLKIDIYPAQTLAKAPQSYAATVSGVADITVTAQGYTAGRFPLTQVIELPGIVKTAENASCVLQGLYDENLISREYQDTHPLFFFAHGPGHIHTREKPVLAPEDMNGLRIRRATTVVGELLTSLGAQPVGMPAPETYTAAQRGVIDGVAFPWQAMKEFRLNEQLSHHTALSLYTLSFITTMNNTSYQKLPDDLKAILDSNSGMAWATAMGRKLDQLDAQARQEAIDNGHSFHQVDNPAQNPLWKPVLDGVVASYIAELSAQSLPAQHVYDRAQALTVSCETLTASNL